jgi:hypothetical protein
MKRLLSLLGLVRNPSKAPGFVPWDPTRTDKRAEKMGWITDANGCDIWQGARANGYGQVREGGVVCFVHRLRYECEIGPIPSGTELDHYVCDNGPGGCCNPLHVRPVTRRENVLRGNSPQSINAGKTHCPRSHPLSHANLDSANLARGRRLCRTCENTRHRAARAAKLKRLRFALTSLLIIASGCGGSGSTGPNASSFSAKYGLEAVTPSWLVPVGGSDQKNISAGCMDFRPGGVLIRTILYSQTPYGGQSYLVTETDTWSYSIAGDEISVTDPLGNGSMPETKVIGTTSAESFSLYTILRNGAIPTTRTLQFRKNGSGCY